MSQHESSQEEKEAPAAAQAGQEPISNSANISIVDDQQKNEKEAD